LVCFGAKSRHAPNLATRVQKRALNRVGAQQEVMQCVGNIKPVQRQPVLSSLLQTPEGFSIDRL
jgi:hypothetical protein